MKTLLMRLRLNGPLVVGSLLMLALVVVLILPSFADLPDPNATRMIAQVDGRTMGPPFRPGQVGYVWGSDGAGRDVFARVIYGARPSVGLALGVAAVRALLCIPLGLLAGWRRGWLGRTVHGLSTGFASLPTLVLVIYVVRTLGIFVTSGPWWLLLAVVLVVAGVPRLAEQVRRLTEEAAVRPHIEAAVAAGASGWRIIWKHIFPLLKGDLLVAMTAEMGWVLLMLGQITVFGMIFGGAIAVPREGALPLYVERLPEWGQAMGINVGLLRTHPWVPYAPAAALGLTVVGFQLLAEGIRQRWIRR
ncbi:MAG TPA: ABC transporter permease subunit [Symbiobacteriaceae bacterium]|nr:ABC transporter permease subunit [Symbiobacteriaceae bacterium]